MGELEIKLQEKILRLLKGSLSDWAEYLDAKKEDIK